MSSLKKFIKCVLISAQFNNIIVGAIFFLKEEKKCVSDHKVKSRKGALKKGILHVDSVAHSLCSLTPSFP